MNDNFQTKWLFPQLFIRLMCTRFHFRLNCSVNKANFLLKWRGLKSLWKHGYYKFSVQRCNILQRTFNNKVLVHQRERGALNTKSVVWVMFGEKTVAGAHDVAIKEQFVLWRGGRVIKDHYALEPGTSSWRVKRSANTHDSQYSATWLNTCGNWRRVDRSRKQEVEGAGWRMDSGFWTDLCGSAWPNGEFKRADDDNKQLKQWEFKMLWQLLWLIAQCCFYF